MRRTTPTPATRTQVKPSYLTGAERGEPLSKREARLHRLWQVRQIAEYLGIGWIGLERGKILVSFNGGVYRLAHLPQAEEWMATWLRRNEAGDRSWFDQNCRAFAGCV